MDPDGSLLLRSRKEDVRIITTLSKFIGDGSLSMSWNLEDVVAFGGGS